MLRTIPTALLCWLFLLAQSHGQDVFVPRQLKAIAIAQSDKEHPPQIQKARATKETVVAKQPVTTQPIKTTPVKEPPANSRPERVQSVKAEPVKGPAVKETPANPRPERVQSVKAEPVKEPAVKEAPASPHPEKIQSAKAEPVKGPTVKEQPANPHADKIQSVKAEQVKVPAVKEPPAHQRPEKVQSAKTEPVKVPAVKELPAKPRSEKIQSVRVEPVKMSPTQEPTVNVQLLNRPMETASTRLADGFDFPVGKPEAEGYYKARGFRSGGHLGEDWDGVGGGDTDFNDPIYSIGDGIVVFARDVHLGWGNVVIVRHAYRENGGVKHIDSLYGHLNTILVNRGQKVARGQQIGTMGTAHGQYDAHLHLEIRKNLEIGMSRSKFQKDFSNYYDPSQFIASHRHLSGGGANFRVAMNTFTHDSAYHFDDAPNFSAHKRSTAESAAALKRAISSTTP
jgi:murein DD-endopeptidase MepM/ murein hydrolase activator NlpD